MSDDPVQGVIETIDCANQHRLKLTELLISLNDAKAQVKESATKSHKELQKHFDDLRAAINAALDERQSQLQGQVTDIETAALVPLRECEDIIQSGITNSAAVLNEGKKLLSSDHVENKTVMEEFKNKIESLNLNSLPDVPTLSDVACIFVDLPENGSEHLTGEICDYGRVIARAPVQIVDISERPGALLIKWCEVEEECALDLSEFRLQYCSGSQQNTDNSSEYFTEIYQGASTAHIMRHLKPLTSYTFRVSGRAEGTPVWSPWSVPYTAMTTLPHFQWEKSNGGYELSNENKVATRQGSLSDTQPVLYSTSNTYSCGHSIIFKVLGDNRLSSEDGIAMTADNTNKLSLANRLGSLFVSSEGKVYIDGQEKITKLPALTRGSVLTFDTYVLHPGKVRVTIEVDEKIVTFDWTIDPSRSGQGSEGAGMAMGMKGDHKQEATNLYFAMKFTSEEWKVAVE